MAPSEGKISLAPLLAVNFVGTLGFSIVVPFLVVLVTRWGGNAVVYGILAATYSFFQLFGAPILGRLSDRIGWRKVLLFSQFGTLISWGIFLIAFALPADTLMAVSNRLLGDFAITLPLLVLFVARAADGLTGGNVSVSNAYLADITSDADRSKNFGRMAISTNLGFIVGPALAGLLGATLLGEVIPVAAAFVISAAALALIQFGLKEVAPVPISENLEDPNACAVCGQEHKRGYRLACEPADGIGAMLALPNMPGLLAVNFLVMLGFSFFYVAFPVYAVQGLGWEVIDIGVYFATLSFFMVVVQGPVLAWAASRASERALMTGGSVALGLGFLTLVSADTATIYLSAALIAVGNWLMWPTFMSALSKSAGTRLQGAVQGFAASAGAVASIVGLVAGGIAYVRLEASIFLIAAAIKLLVAVISAVYSPKVSDAAP
jgi:MFS family permease